MDAKIEKALQVWHTHFEDEELHYSEYEPSDIEYFLGCMLYNHFSFSKAVPTMKTIDLSYDFLNACNDEVYKKVEDIVSSIAFEEEEDAVVFLLNYIEEACSRYEENELYLLHRLQKHVQLLHERYKHNVEPTTVDFTVIKMHG